MPKKSSPKTAPGTWSKECVERGIFRRKNSATGEVKFFANYRSRRGTASGTFTTLKQARDFIAKSKTDISNDRFFGNLPGAKLGVAAAVEKFIAERKSTNQTFLARAQWWADQCRDLPLNELDAERVANLLGELRATGVSGATLNRYKSVLSGMWRHWSTARVGSACLVAIEKNPARSVAKETESDPRVITLDKAERAALLDACKDDIELLAAVRLALTSGCRHGELAKLRWKDVDLAHGSAMLTKTKNGRNRAIAFDSATVAVFKKLVRGIGNTHVFGERIRKRSMLRTLWTKALKRAGLAPMRWHDLRHVSVQVAIESGSSLMEAGLHTGHSSLAALSRYAHLDATHQRKIASRVGDAL